MYKHITSYAAGHRHTSTPAEVQFLYDEQYSERCYLQHGVSLAPGATVIDVGANIGMFSMFAAEVGHQQKHHEARLTCLQQQLLGPAFALLQDMHDANLLPPAMCIAIHGMVCFSYVLAAQSHACKRH
jgi:hypothetical protein